MTRHSKHTSSGRTRFSRVLALGAAAVLALGASDASASARASKNSPGPVLTTPVPALAAALSCPQGVKGKRTPVLLVSRGDPVSIFSAGLEPVLRAYRYPVCTITPPEAGFGDIQIVAEYVVASIRSMAARSGRPVSVVGVSQGATVQRWALKWWPDVRSLVGDVIGLAPGNHGLPLLATICKTPCPPASRQQTPSSQLLAALNNGDETPGRLSYSMISSATDVNVRPPSPALSGEKDDSNTQVQEICPGREVDHGHIQYDAVAVGLVLDALRHPGPARAARMPGTTCAKTYADGIDPGEVDRQSAADGKSFGDTYASAGLFDAELPLKEYATRAAPQPRATLRIHTRQLSSGHAAALSFLATGRSGHDRWALPGARIKIAGRKTVTNRKGRASLRLPMSHRSSLRVRLIAPGLGRVTVRVRA
jgi:hypothetical protein